MNQLSPSATQPRANPWRMETVRIMRIVSETPGVKTYDLQFVDASAAAAFQFRPGQFNMLYAPGIGEAAISISGGTDDGLLRHTIRTVGDVTGALDRAQVGMTLGLRGPFGAPWPVDLLAETDGDKPNVILAAGGIGLAPLRSVVDQLIRSRDAADRVDVLIGARSPADLLYESEYQSWSDQGVAVRTTVDRATEQWQGQIGVVTLLIDRLAIPRPESTLVLTCGPEVMMRYVVQAAVRRGIPESNVWVSLERNMQCAIGLCGHCQLGPEFVCKDGPVFRYDRVVSWMQVQAF